MWSSQCVCLIDQLRIRYTHDIHVINIAHESHIRISEMSHLSLLALCKTLIGRLHRFSTQQHK